MSTGVGGPEEALSQAGDGMSTVFGWDLPGCYAEGAREGPERLRGAGVLGAQSSKHWWGLKLESRWLEIQEVGGWGRGQRQRPRVTPDSWRGVRWAEMPFSERGTGRKVSGLHIEPLAHCSLHSSLASPPGTPSLCAQYLFTSPSHHAQSASHLPPGPPTETNVLSSNPTCVLP